MSFYTDVRLLGDDILFCGYEHGERVTYREKCRPTLYFVPSDQSKVSKFKTLDGRYAHPKPVSYTHLTLPTTPYV